MQTELLLFYGSILAIIGMLLSKTSFRIGFPTLLLFLGVGMVAGYTNTIRFNNPEATQAIGTIALIIILFSGGIDTNKSDVKPIAVRGIVLATVGVLFTALLTGTFIYYLFQLFGFDLPFTVALLFASVMASTDSASVFSILRSQNVHLKNNLKPLLEFESGSNDPMAYMLTIILVSMIQSGEFSAIDGIVQFLLQFAIGSLIGYGMGKGTVWIVNRIKLPSNALYSILLLAISCLIFTTTTFLHGNGYLAVYFAGFVIGNSKMVHKKNIMRFFDGFQWLCQLIMFLTLGLLVNVQDLIPVATIAVLIALFLMFVGRPMSVFISLLPWCKKMDFRSVAFISWIGLRGAVPIIFALIPWVEGLEHAQLIFNVVFFITLLSLILQGSTVIWSAKKLKLIDETKKDVVFNNVDLPEEIKSTISEMIVSKSMLAKSDQLKDLPIPDHTLAIMVQRDGQFFIPRGETPLQVGDHVLMISDDEDALIQAYEDLGINTYSLDRNL